MFYELEISEGWKIPGGGYGDREKESGQQYKYRLNPYSLLFAVPKGKNNLSKRSLITRATAFSNKKMISPHRKGTENMPAGQGADQPRLITSHTSLSIFWSRGYELRENP